jgi:DinB superfamily
MLSQVKLLDEMDESMWQLLRKNLAGITEQEADWRPHPAANPVRWMLGHLAWFEEWACAALADPAATRQTKIRPRTSTAPSKSCSRASRRRARYRKRLADLTETDLTQQLSYFGRYDVSVIELLKTHALHLAGHRFQIRYVRGTYSRAHDTSKSDFDPW